MLPYLTIAADLENIEVRVYRSSDRQNSEVVCSLKKIDTDVVRISTLQCNNARANFVQVGRKIEDGNKQSLCEVEVNALPKTGSIP